MSWKTAIWKMGRGRFVCDGIDTDAMVRASVKPYFMYFFQSSGFIDQNSPDGSETPPSTRFYNPGGFITKHGFICQITR